MIVGYVDPSADAAIAGEYKDFKFKNNTKAPIYIEGSANGSNVSFTIYGQVSYILSIAPICSTTKYL